MRRATRRLASSIVVIALAIPGVGRADDLDGARSAFLEAMALGNQGRWVEATARYAESLRLHRSARTLYSLAVAQSESGRLVEARESFTAFLAEPSSDKTREYEPVARADLAEIEKRLAHITIVLEPATVAHPSVSIDGEAVPDEGLKGARPVNPGSHQIVARASGYTEARAQMTIPEGGAASVTLTLVPISAPPITPPVLVAPLAVAPGKETLISTPPPRSGPRRTLSFALMGVGGAVFVAGAGVGLFGLAQAHSATSRIDPEADAAKTKGLAGDVVGACGIAAAGIGLVLLLTAPRPKPSAAGAWITGNGAGASLHF